MPCVFSADATGANVDDAIVVGVVGDDEGADVAELGVVGSENISSSCSNNNKSNVILVQKKSTRTNQKKTMTMTMTTTTTKKKKRKGK
jgi:hypothetical protein